METIAKYGKEVTDRSDKKYKTNASTYHDKTI
jgi:hypothetical protein